MINFNLSLTCYGFCPQGEVSQTLAGLHTSDETAVNNQESGAFSTSGKAFTFDSSNMLLEYNNTAVVLDPSVSSSNDIRFELNELDRRTLLTLISSCPKNTAG